MQTKFEPDKYNDAPYVIAFLAHIGVVLLATVVGASQGNAQAAEQTAAPGSPARAALLRVVSFWHTDHTASAHAAPAVDQGQLLMALAFTSIVTATIVAGIWLVLLTVVPTEVVKVALISVPVLFAAMTVFVFMQGQIIVGAFFAVFTLLAVWMVYSWWDRAEFTGRLFKSVSGTYGRSRAVFGVAVMMVVAQAAYLVLATLCFAVGKNIGVYLLVVFGIFWTQNVLSYMLYVTCGGVVARWYYGEQTDEAVSKSGKAACTNFFGSICFGSLVITIVQFLKFLVRQAQEQAEEDGNVLCVILSCITQAILGCLEDMLEFVNANAFSYISIYGMPFCDAAKQAWELLCNSDAELLVNYSLVGIVTGFSCLVGGISTGAVSAIMAWRLELAVPMILMAFIVGLIFGIAVMSIISIMMEGGCNTLFICFAESPNLLINLDPYLKEAFDESRGLCKRT